MDTRLLKKYAAGARLQFIAAFPQQITDPGGEIVEKCSLLWFQRLVVLRYLDACGYLSSLLPKDFADADFSFRDFNKDHCSAAGELTTRLLEVCCQLHGQFPFLFADRRDHTYSILPQNLCGKDSIVSSLLADLPDSVFRENVESVGWLYQFFLTAGNGSRTGRAVTVEELPQATQLFTPEWIAKYLVHNTVGCYLSSAGDKLEYFIIRQEEKTIKKQAKNPKEIRVLDPACGAGHLLLEAYDVLKMIYLENNYEPQKIPLLILENNLFGFDLDQQALNLARFALLIKAFADDRNLFERPVRLNLYCYPQNLEKLAADSRFLFSSPPEHLSDILELFEQRGAGSLIQIPEKISSRLGMVEESVSEKLDRGNIEQRQAAKILQQVLRLTAALASRFDVVIENPPYMSQRFFPPELKSFIYHHYFDHKRDLFSAFIIRSLKFIKPGGYIGVMSPFVWMFISSYQKLRRLLLSRTDLTSLVQLEYSGFKDATVPICAFTLRNTRDPQYQGDYIQLTSFRGAGSQGPRVLEAVKDVSCSWRYRVSQDRFSRIPGSPLAFWIDKRMLEVFEQGTALEELAPTAIGLNTGDNRRFLRYWYEVDCRKISFNCKSLDEAATSGRKWFPYNKGGQYRKWFGNTEFVLNWEDNGAEVKDFAVQRNKGGHWSRYIQNLPLMFQSGVTWTCVSSSKFGARFLPAGFLFDVAGSAAFPAEQDQLFICSLLCSRFAFEALKVLNPTLNFQAGNVGRVPVLLQALSPYRQRLEEIAAEAIAIAKEDWNELETSWDFKGLPLLEDDFLAETIKESVEKRLAVVSQRVQKMKELEAENNRIIEEALRLDSRRSGQEADQVTLYQGNEAEEVKRLISYALGCAFGRYHPSRPGLIYPTDSKAASRTIIPLSFAPTCFDDALKLIKTFVKSHWDDDKLEENLTYIGEVLGVNQNLSGEAALRRYLALSFYKDHLKLYKKRPIYWLFSSGRKKSFQCLVYIHSFNQDTLPLMRESYLDPLMERLHSESVEKGGREATEIRKRTEEVAEFTEKITTLAAEALDLNLDDGVKANFRKFRGLVDFR